METIVIIFMEKRIISELKVTDTEKPTYIHSSHNLAIAPSVYLPAAPIKIAIYSTSDATDKTSFLITGA